MLSVRCFALGAQGFLDTNMMVSATRSPDASGGIYALVWLCIPKKTILDCLDANIRCKALVPSMTHHTRTSVEDHAAISNHI